MEIRFPEQRDEFPKTMLQFVVSVILALAVGLFLGNGLGALFGTDESVVNTSAYTDRMTAIRTVFTDGDQLDSFARTALAMQDMDGLRLYTSRGRDHVMSRWEGRQEDAFGLFDEDIRRSLVELMNTEEALYGVETSGGKPITDVWLRNIAVEDGVVYYYLYYDDAGFAGVAFDSTHETLYGTDNAMPLTKTSADGEFEWFIIYNMGE